MANIEKIKGYYRDGLWSINRINKLLELGKITQEEYDAITKETDSQSTE